MFFKDACGSAEQLTPLNVLRAERVILIIWFAFQSALMTEAFSPFILPKAEFDTLSAPFEQIAGFC